MARSAPKPHVTLPLTPAASPVTFGPSLCYRPRPPQHLILNTNLVVASLTRSGTPLPVIPAASSAVPKGRTLEPGVDAVYDVSTRAAGEEQPQLEVSPITMYVTEYAER